MWHEARADIKSVWGRFVAPSRASSPTGKTPLVGECDLICRAPSLDNWLLAGHSISRIWGLVLVALVHLGVLVLHVTSRQVSRQTARQVMVISLGYMMLMGLLVAGLLAMEMSSVIAVCLLLASMIYFLLTLSYLSKRAEGK